MAFISLAKLDFNGLCRDELVRTGNWPNTREAGLAFWAHPHLLFVASLPVPEFSLSTRCPFPQALFPARCLMGKDLIN